MDLCHTKECLLEHVQLSTDAKYNFMKSQTFFFPLFYIMTYNFIPPPPNKIDVLRESKEKFP